MSTVYKLNRPNKVFAETGRTVPTDAGRVPLERIKMVRLIDTGTADVVFTADRTLNSGITVTEVRAGQASLDLLLIALGWQPGLLRNEALLP